MMRKRIITSMMVIALMAAMIGGGTLAWFTDSDTAGEAMFTAGTVRVRAGEAVITTVDGGRFNNWNPGDTHIVCWEFENEGTKRIKIRFKPEFYWENEELDVNNVIISLTERSISAGWTYEDGFFYFGPVLGRGQKTKLCLNVHLDGPRTGNEYQGAIFKLYGTLEAVQASHGAPEEVWNGNAQ